MPDLAARMPRIRLDRVWVWQIVYSLKAVWRHVRTTAPLTWLLGRQYQRSRDLIEVDITYLCNLHCHNCNRSVSQARDSMHMTIETVRNFVNESVQRGKRWRRIRVLGGEPTLHPDFQTIIQELLLYRRWNPSCIVEIVSNGYGTRVARELESLPEEVMVANTAKSGPVQPHFSPFNLAPVDDMRYVLTDFSNACVIARDCGMGLTPMGYYPCAIAGGIDRILGANLGTATLPLDDDDMVESTRRLCRLCGLFRDGHFVPRALRPKLEGERVSPTWRNLYDRWHEAKAASHRPVTITLAGRALSRPNPDVRRDPTQTA